MVDDTPEHTLNTPEAQLAGMAATAEQLRQRVISLEMENERQARRIDRLEAERNTYASILEDRFSDILSRVNK